MRTFILAAAICALAAPANATTRNFGITGFSKIRVDGPYKVSLRTGVAPFANASGSALALDGLTIEVRDDTLIVHNNLDSWSGYPGKDVGPVEISLGTHELSAAWLNGSGSLSINHVQGLKFGLSVQGSGSADIAQAAVDQFNVSVLGTASARLAGHAGMVTAVIRGISTLDASALSTRDATLGADGAATIAADISGTVKVDASGPATVKLTGGPACILQVSGSASVSGCR
jgi:hypothetical protein